MFHFRATLFRYYQKLIDGKLIIFKYPIELKMLSIYQMLEFSLLVLNGLAIINKERVLNKYLRNRQQSFHSNDENSISLRIVNLVLAIQTVLRFPLIFLNIIVMCFKLLFG